MRLLVDSTAFMAQLERDVAAASRSIHAQVMSFEGDEAGTHFASLLTGRRDLERTLIIDRYSRYHISDRFLPSPRNILNASLWRERRETLRVAGALAADGVRVHWTNPVGFCFLEFVSRNHKKSIVIDDRIVYLGGINVCDHNFAWHDFMLRIEDERAGAFMRDDIRATLGGENLSSRRDFGSFEIALLDGEKNPQLMEPVLRLVRGARRSIVVQSAYLTFPVFDHLAEAAGRGVAVTLVTPKHNNMRGVPAYQEWAAARAGVTVRFYDGRMSHIKAMLVDDEALVVGSSNFDYFSFHTYQEVVVIVRDPEVIARYARDVLQPDLAQSVAPAGEYSHIRQASRERAARLAGRAAVEISQWLRGWRSAPERPAPVAPAQAEPGVSSPE